MLFSVEALNRHLLVCDRDFFVMISQSAQEQTVEVIKLVPKEQISEHIVQEIVVLAPQVMEKYVCRIAQSNRLGMFLRHRLERKMFRRPSRSHKNESQSAVLKRAKPTAG